MGDSKTMSEVRQELASGKFDGMRDLDRDEVEDVRGMMEFLFECCKLESKVKRLFRPTS